MGGWRRVVVSSRMAALSIALIAARPLVSSADTVAGSTLKAAFTLNFVKFTTWPDLRAGSPLLVCISSEDTLSEAMIQAFAGQSIGGHAIRVTRVNADASVRDCQLLFISEREPRRFAATLDEAGRLPMLTVSDADRSAKRGAAIELFVEDGRLRFAVNIDTLDRSGLKMSSRLLSLAKTVRNTDSP